MTKYPTTPLAAFRSHWTHSLEWKQSNGAGIPLCEANGDDISSGSPEGCIKRLYTWLRNNDIGGEEKENLAVVVKVMGAKTMMLTPVHRWIDWTCAEWPLVNTRFTTMLWFQGREIEPTWSEFSVCEWRPKARN